MRILMAGSFTYRAHVKVGIHHYADRFAGDGWKVLFLSSQLSALHLFRGRDRLHSAEKFRLWRKGGQWYGNVFSYSYMTLLPLLPVAAPGTVLRNTLRFTVPSLKSVAHGNGFPTVDVLWLENPHLVDMPRFIPHRVLVCRVADKISGFEGYPAGLLEEFGNVVRSADLVIATADSLFREYSGMDAKGEVLCVPNGVDFEHFNVSGTGKPKEYEDMHGPIALYMGCVAPWFDQDLVLACAERLKHISFVVLGPGMTDTSRMEGVRNIHLLGPRGYDELPPYVAHADVGIIPFRPGKLVNAINPVKLYEYMAAGLPVVCTDWEELRKMSSPAMLAADADRFCACLKKAVGMRPSREAISFARENSWRERYSRVAARIGALL